jgi:hypothetical protein
VEIDAVAHVYLNGPKGVQSDSNPAIWKAMTIPRNNIRELIESMPRRCRAVLVAVLTLT